MRIKIHDGWAFAIVVFIMAFVAFAFWAGAALFMPARTQQGPPTMRPALMSTVHASSTWLELRAYPHFSIRGRDPVILIGEIKGEESEDYYCRYRELWWNGDRVSGHGEDCPPYEERMDFERRWAYYLPRVPGDHRAEWVLLTAQDGQRVASTSATWVVR